MTLQERFRKLSNERHSVPKAARECGIPRTTGFDLYHGRTSPSRAVRTLVGMALDRIEAAESTRSHAPASRED